MENNDCINRIEYIFKLFNIFRQVNQHEFITTKTTKIDFKAYSENKNNLKVKEVTRFKGNDYSFNSISLSQVPVEPSDFSYEESKTYCKHCGKVI